MNKTIDMGKAHAQIMDSFVTAFETVLDQIEEQCAVDDFEQSNTPSDQTFNAVHKPYHYTHGKYECIEVMEDCFGKDAVQHFCLLNAFKYLWRTNHKNGLEDIKKARRYLDLYLELSANDNEG